MMHLTIKANIAVAIGEPSSFHSIVPCGLQDGGTILHYAAKLDNKDVAALMLDRGANTNAITKVNVAPAVCLSPIQLTDQSHQLIRAMQGRQSAVCYISSIADGEGD
jgi:ankyrin repeat protein